MSMRALGYGIAAWVVVAAGIARGQSYGQPDRGEPGDEMIQAYLAGQAKATRRRVPRRGRDSAEDWEENRPRLHREFLDMLGLWPLPEKTPLKATVTGTLRGRRVRRREAALPERAGAVRHRQPVSAREGQGRGEAAGDPLRLRPLRQGPRRQQDGLPGARHLVRPARLRLPGRRHAAARRDRRRSHHGTYNLERVVVALAGLHAGRRRVLERRPRASTTSSAGPTSIPSGSASPASAAAGRRRSGSPRPTSA